MKKMDLCVYLLTPSLFFDLQLLGFLSVSSLIPSARANMIPPLDLPG
jgi:hypothetical protein